MRSPGAAMVAIESRVRRKPKRWSRLKTFALVLLPFALALVLSLSFRIYMMLQAVDGLGRFATEISVSMGEGDQRHSMDEVVQAIGKGGPPSIEETGYRERLVRTIYRQLVLCANDTSPVACVKRDARRKLEGGDILADALIQTVLVLIFPGLFLAALSAAARRSVDDRPHGPAGPGARATLREADPLEARVRRLREAALLSDEETQPYFFRRVGFALFIALGTQYILSPAGLQGSLLADYASLSVEPGATSHPFASVYLLHAPAYVIGFAGFYLYALITTLNRFMDDTLSHRLFLSLLQRGITVWIVSVVIAGVVKGEGTTTGLVFIAGMFPDTGWQYLVRLARGAGANVATADPKLVGFRAIPEIDVEKESSLNEVGVRTVHDLAHESWALLLASTRNQPRSLLLCADRALLFDTIGVDRAEGLSVLGIRTASGLVAFADHGPADATALLMDAMQAKNVSTPINTLRAHPNLQFLAWLNRSNDEAAAGSEPEHQRTGTAGTSPEATRDGGAKSAAA